MSVLLETLGTLRVQWDGEVKDSLPRQTVRCALLLYLAVEREVTRDATMGMFWGDKSPERARGALNQTLYELRKDLGDEWVETRGDFLVVAEDLQVDAVEFRRLIEEGKHDEAVQLYGGPFLGGSTPSAGIQFEQWADKQRSRLAADFRKARRSRTEEFYGAGDREAALAEARGWLETDPLEDEAAHWVIRLLAELGRKSQALQEYDRYAALLKEELEVEPLDETQELIDRVRRGEDVSLPEQVPAPPTGAGGPVDSVSRAGTHPAVRVVRALGILVLVWLGVRAMLPDRARPLDASTVVGFPLVSRGADDDLGEDLAAFLGMALDEAGPLVWVDGWRWLDEDLRSDPSRVTPRIAEEISGDRGGEYYILGTVFQELNRLTVTLELHSVSGDSLVDRASATGLLSEETPTMVALGALVELLPVLLGPDVPVDYSLLSQRSASAVALWLGAERAYRLSDFAAARDLYAQAVEEDSTFVMAALGGVVASAWLEEYETAGELAELAIRHTAMLPPRFERFALGLRHYLRGEADQAVGEFEAALEMQPRWPEAWMALGEVYRHLVPEGVRHDSAAAESFRTAAALDQGFTPPLYHLIEFGVRNDLPAVEVAPWVEQFLTSSPLREGAVAVSLMDHCAFGAAELLVPAELPSDAGAVLRAASGLRGNSAQLACADSLIVDLLNREGVIPAHRWGGLLQLHGIRRLRGDDQGALEAVEWGEAEVSGSSALIYLSDETAGWDTGGRAGAFVSGLETSRSGNMSGAPSYILFLIGDWAGAKGDRDRLSTYLGLLDQRVADSGLAADSVFRGALAVRSFAVAGDSAAALEAYRALRMEASQSQLAWDLAAPLAATRLLGAALEELAGGHQAAYNQASVLDHPQPVAFLSYRVPSLRLRGVVAGELAVPGLAEELEAEVERLTAGTDFDPPETR
jgi:DNA-binding SARP family transcriptional activator